jgi:hypothetical protein
MTKMFQAGLWSCLQPPLQRRTSLPVEALPLRKTTRILKNTELSSEGKHDLGSCWDFTNPAARFGFCYSKFSCYL